MTTDISSIARAVESRGFPFLTWAEWYPDGHPDRAWTKLYRQSFPAVRHWVHHSVTSALASPAHAARQINDIGIQRFGKMSYSFLIHADGTVIQGCYPYIGAHTRNYNSTSLAGCNIGNYETLVPSDRMVQANIALIRALIDTGHYSTRDLPIYGHQQSQYASTSCPGQYLMARLPDIRRAVQTPPAPPTPPPTSPTGDDDVFFFDCNDRGTNKLVQGSGGKLVRLTGQEFGTKVRARDEYLGVIDDKQLANYVEAFGQIIQA